MPFKKVYFRSGQFYDSSIANVFQALILSDLKIHLIIIEDTDSKTPSKEIQNLVDTYQWPKSMVKVTIFMQKTLKQKNKTMKGLRGLDQRNLALGWISVNARNHSAMVYFADDDNTYTRFRNFISSPFFSNKFVSF